MTKRVMRFFGGFLQAQENWLNQMAAQGCRLIRTDRLLYEFEQGIPGQVQYRVEWIAHQSAADAEDYRKFLEDLGYRVFYKNINLNYSVGKVRWRPWASKGGRIAASCTTFNRELLLIEKENDGRPFELHTTYEDRIIYIRTLQRPYFFFFAVSVILAVGIQSWLWGIAAATAAAVLGLYQTEWLRLKKQAQMKEW